MIIIIDAYNVLKQIMSDKEITEKQRDQFLSQLGRYAKIKQHKIIVVFDGGPYEWTHKERVNGVMVIYSGVHESADDFIAHYLEDHQTKELLLVSTDREINAIASQLDIPSIDSVDFYRLMQHALHQEPDEDIAFGEQVIKVSEDEHEDLDVLMRQASEFVPLKEEDKIVEVRSRLSAAYTEGKKNKKLMRILKKL